MAIAMNHCDTIIDLRSDASSLPTDEMRLAMQRADCGNDDFAEDPTVRQLEQVSAELLGKEAALFVQSGTMANMIAVLSATEPGQEMLISRSFHLFDYEEAAVRRITQASYRFVETRTNGCMTELDLLSLPDESDGETTLLCLENTVNRLGGTLLGVQHLQEISQWTSQRGLRTHLDGARLLNAATALQVAPAQLAAHSETVSLVFTKALSAPAGAVLAGSLDTMATARKFRWMLGGAWKQGGMLAAACLVGLRTMPDRIFEDHANARLLAEGLNALPGISVDLQRVATNIVFFRVEDPTVDLAQLTERLRAGGVRIGRFKPDRTARLVTHRNISSRDITNFLKRMREELR